MCSNMCGVDVKTKQLWRSLIQQGWKMSLNNIRLSVWDSFSLLEIMWQASLVTECKIANCSTAQNVAVLHQSFLSLCPTEILIPYPFQRDHVHLSVVFTGPQMLIRRNIYSTQCFRQLFYCSTSIPLVIPYFYTVLHLWIIELRH